jgi:hypothetical protein
MKVRAGTPTLAKNARMGQPRCWWCHNPNGKRVGQPAGIDFYAYTLNNPVNWIDPFGLEVQECRRPLSLPKSQNLPPHTFLYSTQSGKGYGLGPKPGWDTLTPWSKVPGNIERDYPYDPSGKLKPNYQCSKVSDDKCFEDCVNQKAQDAARKPPSYDLGTYQCDTWANDIERQCTQQCKK